MPTEFHPHWLPSVAPDANENVKRALWMRMRSTFRKSDFSTRRIVADLLKPKHVETSLEYYREEEAHLIPMLGYKIKVKQATWSEKEGQQKTLKGNLAPREGSIILNSLTEPIRKQLAPLFIANYIHQEYVDAEEIMAEMQPEDRDNYEGAAEATIKHIDGLLRHVFEQLLSGTVPETLPKP